MEQYWSILEHSNVVDYSNRVESIICDGVNSLEEAAALLLLKYQIQDRMTGAMSWTTMLGLGPWMDWWLFTLFLFHDLTSMALLYSFVVGFRTMYTVKYKLTKLQRLTSNSCISMTIVLKLAAFDVFWFAATCSTDRKLFLGDFWVQLSNCGELRPSWFFSAVWSGPHQFDQGISSFFCWLFVAVAVVEWISEDSYLIWICGFLRGSWCDVLVAQC